MLAGAGALRSYTYRQPDMVRHGTAVTVMKSPSYLVRFLDFQLRWSMRALVILASAPAPAKALGSICKTTAPREAQSRVLQLYAAARSRESTYERANRVSAESISDREIRRDTRHLPCRGRASRASMGTFRGRPEQRMRACRATTSLLSAFLLKHHMYVTEDMTNALDNPRGRMRRPRSTRACIPGSLRRAPQGAAEV
jgi:hypothetical protein